MHENIGKKFGKLTVLEFDRYYITPSTGKKNKRWKCLCECGNYSVVAMSKLVSGHTSSCGCLQKTRGGLTQDSGYHTTYSVWNMVVQRTTNENFKSNAGYFGRVSICERWLGLEGFNNFIEDMGLRPSLKHTIERKDVHGDYNKENCIWTDDYSLQAYNQRLRKSNSSGKTGVFLREKRWAAVITKGEIKLKKYFATFEEASVQRDAWELELYGFNKDNTER